MKKFSKLNVNLKIKKLSNFYCELILIKNIKFLVPSFDNYSKIILVTDKTVLKCLNKTHEKIRNLSKGRFLSTSFIRREKNKELSIS